MLRRRISVLFGILTLAAMLAFWGCEGDQGPEGPVGPQGPAGPSEMNAVAILNVFTVNKAFENGYFAMNLYNVPSMPSVKFNDSLLTPEEFALLREGRLNYSVDYTLGDDDSASLSLAYTKLDGTAGAASSKISLPTEFAVLDDAITVSYGDDFEGEWSISEGADAYWIFGYFYFSYTDTNDVDQRAVLQFDTVLAGDDTILSVPATAFLPDQANISDFGTFDGDFYIRAVSGPWLPGEADNFTGDVFGIFTGVTNEVAIDFNLQVIVKSPADINSDIEVDKTQIDEAFNSRIMKLSQE